MTFIQRKRLPKEPVSNGLAAATATVAENVAISVAAEAGQQENPDNPFTTIVSVAAEEATAIVVAVAVTTTAEQKQDNPNPTSTSTVVCVGCTTAVVVASTICCCQIAHNCLQSFVMLYTMPLRLSMFQ